MVQGRADVLIGDGSYTHTNLAGTGACVNLAEAGLDMVVESRAEVDASRPYLNMTDEVVRVAHCVGLEANKVAEFATLARVRVRRVRKDSMSVVLYLEPPVCPGMIFHLHPWETRSGMILWALC